jgi:hypothetical protein
MKTTASHRAFVELLTEDEQFRKLDVMLETARRVWGKLERMTAEGEMEGIKVWFALHPSICFCPASSA